MGFRAPLDTREYERRVGMVRAPEIEQELPEHPVKRGWGPAVFSTCTTLAVRYSIWDVNGYYRALGFTFPYHGIARRELMRGYQEVNGADDEFATYAFKLLRNHHFRAFYNDQPFGDPLFDKYISHAVRSAASRTAGQRVAGGERDVSQESVMDEWGLYSPAGDADVESPPEITSDKPEVSDHSPTVWNWTWGYYLWRSRSRDIERLARWQDLLIAEFARSGVRRQIAVGFMGRQPHRAVRADVGEQLVLLLHEDVEPTHDLAIQMVASCTTTGEVEEDHHGVA